MTLTTDKIEKNKRIERITYVHTFHDDENENFWAYLKTKKKTKNIQTS